MQFFFTGPKYRSCSGFEEFDEAKNMECSQQSSSYLSKYKLQSFYNPKTNGFIDELIIPINLIVLADANGENGAFTQETLMNYEHANSIFPWLNTAYQATFLPTDPVPGYVEDYWLQTTKIKFELNEIYYYNDDIFYLSNGSPGALRELHFSTHPEAKDFVNCFLLKDIDINAGGFAGFYSGTYYSSVPCVMSNAWDDPNEPLSWIEQSPFWYFGEHLPHEFGHLFDLCHTYASCNCCEQFSGSDFLEDVFFNPPAFENICPPVEDGEYSPGIDPTDFCTNNLMSGHQYNRFISPLQAGRCHRRLRLNLIRNFAYGYSSLPHEISNNETWDFIYKSYNDIIVKSGATLTLKCRLEMIKDSKIIIEPEAKLVVDGGVITAALSAGPEHEGYWSGIEIWGNSNERQLSSKQGTLITKNGAIIEFAKEAIQVWKPDDWNSMGGIVNCSNTTFRNNWRSCAYYYYHSYSPSNPSIEYMNKGRFTNCSFEWDDSYIGTAIAAAITMYHVNGVQITGCDFTDNRIGTVTQRPGGIGTIDWIIR